MPWTCRLLPDEPANPQPGDMWLNPDYIDLQPPFLSERYFREVADKRLPLVVALPNGRTFCPDRTSTGEGWTVTGEAPNITISPSIDDQAGRLEGYHGFLQNGVLSDDVDGRVFP